MASNLSSVERWVSRFHTAFLNLSPRIDISTSSRVVLSSTISMKGGEVDIGDNCTIHSGAKILPSGGRISLGSDTTVNPDTILYGHGGLSVGDGVRIAAQCAIVPSNHNYSDPNVPIRNQGLTEEGVKIEDDIWIGAGCKILDGVTIHEGSVIGAGSVVTKSIPPYSVAVGSPAQVVKSRK